MSEIEPHRMDVQAMRLGRDRLVLLGDPQGPELVDGEHHHSCDYMGCGTSHVVGRAVLLRADGDRESWNRAQEMLRLLDAELHPWGEPGVVPTDPGEYFWQRRDSVDGEWGAPEPIEIEGDDDAVLVFLGGYISACELDGVPLVRFRCRWAPEAQR